MSELSYSVNSGQDCDLSQNWLIQMRSQLENMLFNEDHADIWFFFEDGTKIPAHKSVVFPMCPYFKYAKLFYESGYDVIKLISDRLNHSIPTRLIRKNENWIPIHQQWPT